MPHPQGASALVQAYCFPTPMLPLPVSVFLPISRMPCEQSASVWFALHAVWLASDTEVNVACFPLNAAALPLATVTVFLNRYASRCFGPTRRALS